MSNDTNFKFKNYLFLFLLIFSFILLFIVFAVTITETSNTEWASGTFNGTKLNVQNDNMTLSLELPNLTLSINQQFNNNTYKDNSANITLLYHFNLENINASAGIFDDSGRAINGSLAGGMVCGNTSAGRFNEGCSFDGVNDGIRLATRSLIRNRDRFSVEAWAYPKSTPAGTAWSIIFDDVNDGAGSTRFFLGISDGVYGNPGGTDRWAAAFRTGAAASTLRTIPDTTDVVINKWYHVAFTFDSVEDNYRLYIDGVNVANSTVAETPIANTDSTSFPTIGTDTPFDANWFFNGYIDEFAFYNNTLSEAQIREHYRRDKGQFESRIVDMSQLGSNLTNISWVQDINSNYVGYSNITFQVRTCDTATCATNPIFIGYDNTSVTYFWNYTFTNLSVMNLTGRYFQYKTFFTLNSSIEAQGLNLTNNNIYSNQTPRLQSVNFEFVNTTSAGNTAPTFTVNPVINSTFAKNNTNETLNIFFTPTDAEAANLNYSIQVYKNNLTNFTLINIVGIKDVRNVFQINSNNLSRGDTWKAMVNLSDGELFSANINTSELLINSPPIVTLMIPSDTSVLNAQSTTFNYSATDDYGASAIGSCSLYHNQSGSWTFNQSATFPTNFTVSNLLENRFAWNVLCNDVSGLQAYATNNFTFSIDRTTPSLSMTTPTEPTSNTTRTRLNITLDMTCDDSNLHNFNVTLVNVTSSSFYTNSSLDLNVSSYVITDRLTLDNQGDGNISVITTCTDDHTKSNISEWKSQIDVVNRKLNYNTLDNTINITIRSSSRLATSISSDRRSDRFTFNLTFASAPVDINLTVDSQKPIYERRNSGFKGHLVTGNQWVDFECSNTEVWLTKTKETSYNVDIRATSTKVECTSLGGTNSITKVGNIIYDKTSPSTNLTRPVNNHINNSQNILFEYSAADSIAGIKNTSLFHNASGAWKLNATDSSSPFNSFLVENFIAQAGIAWNILSCDLNDNCAYNETNMTLTIDRTAPVISSPVFNATNRSVGLSFNVNITATDSGGGSVASVWADIYQVTGGFVKRVYATLIDSTLNIWRFIIDLLDADFNAGLAYNLTIQTNDTGKNTADNLTRIFVTNYVPTRPSLNLLPNNTETNDRTPTLNWTNATDSDIGDSDLFLNHTLYVFNNLTFISNHSVINGTQINNQTFTFFSNLADNTIYYWFINVSDPNSNKNVSLTRQFTVNSTKTIVNVTNNYPNGKNITDVNINFIYNISTTNTNILLCDFWFDSKRNQTNGSINQGVNTTFIIRDIPSGNHSYFSGCLDNAYNYVNSTNLTIDTTDAITPTIVNQRNHTNTGNLVFVNTTITFNATITDNVNISNVKFSSNLSSIFANLTTNRYNDTFFNITRVLNSTSAHLVFTWFFTATDKAGNEVIGSQQLTRLNNLNPDPGTLTTTNSTTFESRTLTLTWNNATDKDLDNINATIRIVNDLGVIAYNKTVSGNVSALVTLSSDGTFFWNVSWTDNFGGYAVTETRTFIVDTITSAPSDEGGGTGSGGFGGIKTFLTDIIAEFKGEWFLGDEIKIDIKILNNLNKTESPKSIITKINETSVITLKSLKEISEGEFQAIFFIPENTLKKNYTLIIEASSSIYIIKNYIIEVKEKNEISKILSIPEKALEKVKKEYTGIIDKTIEWTLNNRLIATTIASIIILAIAVFTVAFILLETNKRKKKQEIKP